MLNRGALRLTRTAKNSGSSFLLQQHENYNSTLNSLNKVTASHEFGLQPRLLHGPVLGRFSFSTSASPKPKEKESGKSSSEEKGFSADDLKKLSKDDLVKLFKEKEKLLKIKEEAIKILKDGMGEISWGEVSEYDMVRRLREVQGLLKMKDEKIMHLENEKLVNIILFAGLFIHH